MNTIDYAATATEIHASNIKAGWWPADTSQRNRGEVMMLIVSEVAEASEGELTNANDDKLPQHKMFDVELADTAIRLFDLIGADAMQVEPNMDTRIEVMCDQLSCEDPHYDLMVIVRQVSGAMEGHRKGKLTVYADWLWNALAAVYAVADTYSVDLDGLIAEKRRYNATRSDHQIENRQKEGGKRY